MEDSKQATNEEKIAKWGLRYLIIAALFTWGFAVGRYEVFPFAFVKDTYVEIEEFVAGHPEEGTSFLAKIKSEIGLSPARLVVQAEKNAERDYETVPVPNTKARRDGGLDIFARPDGMEPGYRILYGVFDFEPALHGAVLLSPDNEIVHTWQTRPSAPDPKPGEKPKKAKPEELLFPHGFAVLPDGSIIFGFDVGRSLQRIGWCGERLWKSPGSYHHALTVSEGFGKGWVLGPYPLGMRAKATQLDLEDGRVLERIALAEVLDKNPGLDIFGLRQVDFPDRSKWHMGKAGHWHVNDIEPLPAELAPAFPQFEAGDLLMSMRAINLIFVLDPDTLAVKWWRMGQTRRQHDPDWQPDGTISVYDNNMHRGPSRILSIDPKTYEVDTLVDGSEHDFYSRIRGKHQVLPGGNVLVTSSQQGRVFEVTPEGELVFEAYNTYDVAEKKRLIISQAVWLPESFFDFDEFTTCSGDNTPG